MNGAVVRLTKIRPQELESAKANTKLSDTFDVSTNHLVLVDADVPQKDVVAMTDEMQVTQRVNRF